MEKSADKPQSNIIRPKPRITLEPTQVVNMPYKVGEELLALNNKWGAPLLQNLPNSYVVHPPENLTSPQIVANEFIQADKEIINKKQKDTRLEKNIIMQFLNRSSINVESGQVFELKPISNIHLNPETKSQMKPQVGPQPGTPTKEKNKTQTKAQQELQQEQLSETQTQIIDRPFLSLPPPLSSLSVTYLHVILSPISVHGSAITLSNYKGCLFLLDKEKATVASEAAYFSTTDGQPRFVQTNGSDLYFEVQNCKPSLLLVIILMHSNALNLDDFVEEITSRGPPKEDPSKTPIPFAYSYITPFEKDNTSSTISFNFPWSLLRPADDFSALFDNTSSDLDSISLIGKATIQVLPFENLPRVRLTSEGNEGNKDTDVFNNEPKDSPLLALSIPQRTFFPTSIISLSSITFTFNNPPKGDFCQFRVFLSENITDPIKPDSIPVFISRASEPMTSFYESIGMPLSKRIVFPDIIRMRLDKPLTQTSNIIIQFITVTKKTQTIYKLTAFPLFDDSNIIQTRKHQFYTHHVKDLKGVPDYLLRCQKSKKSVVSINIDIPQVFYPPPLLAELSSALVSQQVKLNELKQLQPQIILPQLIPIFSKLLSIISKDLIPYLFDLLSTFKPNDSKPQIKSWLFHNFDPRKTKTNFFSSFISSFNLMVDDESNSTNEVYSNVIKSFDIICDVLITSYMLKQEDYTPIFLYTMFNNISKIICSKSSKGHANEIIEMNSTYGDLLFIFHSLIDKYVMDAVRFHIKKLVNMNKPELLFLIWNFLMRFTETNEFTIFIASHFPVKPISRIIFTPYHPVTSIIFYSITKTLKSNDSNSIDHCCNFIYSLFKPLEQDEVKNAMRYRVAYAFYPILEILTNYFETLDISQRVRLLPPILFLLGYSPQQLTRYHFIANTSNLQTPFVTFLNLTIDTIIQHGKSENETIETLSYLFEELTKRILQILNFNIRGMKEFLPISIEILNKLMNSSYQAPSNYPLLFDTVSRVIHYYPCEKSLVMSILSNATSHHHLVRCFGASLVLLFFKSDYDIRKTVVQSSIEVLDSVTNLMLNLKKIDDIALFKLMLSTISEISINAFNNEDFTQKLNERTTAANNIANIVEEMRRDPEKRPEEQCKYAMKIADQYRKYPSMRSYWLREIVKTNLDNKSNSSAFVAQLHICALIATVIMYENSLENSVESSEFKKQFNLLVCQPISFGKKFILSSRLFEFFPSVLEETKIDSSTISKDFKFLANAFTLQYLNESLVKAIEYGNAAKLYYSVRPLYSLQLRIMAELDQYKSMGKVCEETSELFRNLKANGTITHTNPLSFFVALNSNNASNPNEKLIYAIEDANFSSFVEDCAANHIAIQQVYEFEEGSNMARKKAPKNFENQHCWNIFRSKPAIEYLKNIVTDVNKPEIELIQYTTKNPLPFYIISSVVVNEQKAYISLVQHVQLEAQKIENVVNLVSAEFERLFPCRNTNKFYGDYTIHYKDDVERIIAALQLIFPLKLNNQAQSDQNSEATSSSENMIGNSNTLFELMKLLVSKNGLNEANAIAQDLKPLIERMMSVYKTVIDNSSDKNYDYYDIAKDHFINFRNEFKLDEVGDFKAYQGRIDPLLEKFDYE